MKIINKQVSDLIPYVNNARTHSDIQVNQIASSIKEFGFCNPVLIDGQNGIIAGHGRVLAAQKLCLKEVPTIELSHLTDTQRKAYILADNRLAELSGWDDELLKLELTGLELLEFDLALIGFDGLSIDGSVDNIEIKEINDRQEKIKIIIECLEVDYIDVLNKTNETLKQYDVKVSISYEQI
jgi:ParB-like chromosome segregation protein Spo0J